MSSEERDINRTRKVWREDSAGEDIHRTRKVWREDSAGEDIHRTRKVWREDSAGEKTDRKGLESTQMHRGRLKSQRVLYKESMQITLNCNSGRWNSLGGDTQLGETA
jgi:hypothetical protein